MHPVELFVHKPGCFAEITVRRKAVRPTVLNDQLAQPEWSQRRQQKSDGSHPPAPLDDPLAQTRKPRGQFARSAAFRRQRSRMLARLGISRGAWDFPKFLQPKGRAP